jgi:hypothetical protein
MAQSRDNQRSAVYRWNHRIIDENPGLQRQLTESECRQLVDEIWKTYFPTQYPPTVTIRKSGRNAGYHPTGHYIILPPWSRVVGYVLHEVCHSLLRNKTIARNTLIESHGPTFCQLLLDLIDRFAPGIDVIKLKRLGKTQKPRRVRFASPFLVPKPHTSMSLAACTQPE